MTISLSPQSLNSTNLKKITATLAVVAIAHLGTLWAIGQMQPPALKPLKKTPPIEVKLITLKKELPPPPKAKLESPKPEPKKEPPKPVEKPKPKLEPPKPLEKPKPKPQTPPPPAPKVIAAPQPVIPKINAPQVTQKEVVKDFKPSPVQDPNQTVKEPPKEIVKEPIKELPKEVVKEPVKEPPIQPDPTPPAPKVDTTTPRQVAASQISWRITPRLTLPDTLIEKATNKSIKVKVTADAKGKVNATIMNGSGNAEVDRAILRAVHAGRLNPYTENGVAVPVSFAQPFHL